MPTSYFSAAYIKMYIGIFDCFIRLFDRSIREYRSFDTVDAEVLEKLRPLLFRGVLAFLAFFSAHICNKT